MRSTSLLAFASACAGDDREHDLHVIRPDGHRSDHRDRARRDRRRDVRREGGRDQSADRSHPSDQDRAPTVNTSSPCSLSASTWSPVNRQGSRRADPLGRGAHGRPDPARRHRARRRQRHRDRRSAGERAQRSIPAAPRSATPSPRSRSPTCRSTAATSCSCCSSAPAPSRRTGEQGGMRQGVGNAISIMGARPTSNNFMIDGTANIDTSIGTPAAVLSVDAIQEFKEQTTTYSAEYGFSSNQINLVSKTRNERVARHRLRVLQERRLGRPELLRRQDRSGADAGSEAVRVRRRRPGDAARLRRAEPHVLPRQLRGDADRPRRDELLHRADAGGADGTLHHTDHRSGDRRAVPEQHHSAVAILAARAARHPEQLVPGAEHHGRAGQLPGGAHLPAGPGPVHDSRGPGSGEARPRVRPLYEHQLREHDRRQP